MTDGRLARYVSTGLALSIAGVVIVLLLGAIGTLGWADRAGILTTVESAAQKAQAALEQNARQDIEIAVMRQKFLDIDAKLEKQGRQLDELLKRTR